MRVLERSAREAVADRHVVRDARDQFEAHHARAQSLASQPQKRQRVLRGGEADEGRRADPRIGKEPQRGGGDDAERSLGADEQALEVVAGIVLAQLAEGVDHPPVRQHRLDAGDEIAGIAVGDHSHPAGVGRDIAADGAGSLRAQRQRKEPVGGERGALSLRERHAGLADHHVGLAVDLADRVQTLSRENDFIAALVRSLSADESGVAPLRHDADPRLVAESGDRGDFPRRARPHEGESLAPVEAARLDQRAGEDGRVGQHMARSCDVFQRGKNSLTLRRVQPRSLRTRGFAFGRRKTAAISTCGEKRNWSSGVTASIR